MPNKRLRLRSTPYTEIHHRLPDLSHLRNFGCEVYMVLPPHYQPNIGLTAIKGIFLGSDEPHSSAHLVYYNNKVHRSGHVHFNEDLSSKVHSLNESHQLYPMTMHFDLLKLHSGWKRLNRSLIIECY